MPSNKETMSQVNDFFNSFEQLADFCSKEEYKGYDPYDSLNSKLFQSIPLLSKSRIAKLAWTQFFKRAPMNLRPLVGVPKEVVGDTILTGKPGHFSNLNILLQ